ncbi:MAG: ArsR family transcriptional regulator [Lachnospiraceae bacterium]|nr:ArsR family transcriptional regulator [Lachnospiraceae bacterium]
MSVCKKIVRKGNPTRICILLLLMEQDTCVSDLAEHGIH